MSPVGRTHRAQQPNNSMRSFHTVVASPQRIVGQDRSSAATTESENELDTSSSEEVSPGVTSSSGDGNDLGATPVQDPPLASSIAKEVPKVTVKRTATI